LELGIERIFDSDSSFDLSDGVLDFFVGRDTSLHEHISERRDLKNLRNDLKRFLLFGIECRAMIYSSSSVTGTPRARARRLRTGSEGLLRAPLSSIVT